MLSADKIATPLVQLQISREQLRDYFAAAAIQGVLHSMAGWSPSEVSRCAYEIADAMLAEREG